MDIEGGDDTNSYKVALVHSYNRATTLVLSQIKMANGAFHVTAENQL